MPPHVPFAQPRHHTCAGGATFHALVLYKLVLLDASPPDSHLAFDIAAESNIRDRQGRGRCNLKASVLLKRVGATEGEGNRGVDVETNGLGATMPAVLCLPSVSCFRSRSHNAQIAYAHC